MDKSNEKKKKRQELTIRDNSIITVTLIPFGKPTN